LFFLSHFIITAAALLLCDISDLSVKKHSFFFRLQKKPSSYGKLFVFKRCKDVCDDGPQPQLEEEDDEDEDEDAEDAVLLLCSMWISVMRIATISFSYSG